MLRSGGKGRRGAAQIARGGGAVEGEKERGVKNRKVRCLHGIMDPFSSPFSPPFSFTSLPLLPKRNAGEEGKLRGLTRPFELPICLTTRDADTEKSLSYIAAKVCRAISEQFSL